LRRCLLQILSTSGAHFSRYLLQVAIHHYFRTTSHFIKSPWVRNLPLGVFTHFMSLGSRYGMDIPLAKGEDDGSLFTGWLKEKTTPGLGKKVDVQVIKDLFQKYGFMMFAPKVCFILWDRPACDQLNGGTTGPNCYTATPSFCLGTYIGASCSGERISLGSSG